MDGQYSQMPPSDPALANLFDALPESWREAWSERCAILEFDAGFSRPEAERMAMDEVIRQLQERPEC